LSPSASHLDYFQGYLEHVGALTMVVEREYVDRAYLEDFSSYYVRCFAEYQRKCARLHFFALEFSKEDLMGWLTQRDESSEQRLREGYLGFIVRKPLPRTIVGRTCLRTYEEDHERTYPAKRRYSVNLFGLTLEVETLAFQEQDQVVAVCASTALWCVFQGTGMLFHHHIPSPGEITTTATRLLPPETRTLPSDGLSPAQVAHAIRAVGLEPELISVEELDENPCLHEYRLKAALHAYLRLGVPVLMGVDLYDVSDESVHRYLDRHAVAVTGFHLGNGAPPEPKSNFRVSAGRIDQIYVHDDHIGPFAKMEFGQGQVKTRRTRAGNLRTVAALSTAWRREDGVEQTIRAVPVFIVLPLYHKIRLRFAAIHNVVHGLDDLLKAAFGLLGEQAGAEQAEGAKAMCAKIAGLEWDLFLSSVQQFKAHVREDAALAPEVREGLLLCGLPRFLWRAVAHSAAGGQRVIELIFDATDLEQGDYFVRAIDHDLEAAALLRSLARRKSVEEGYPRAHPVGALLRRLGAA